MAQVLIATMAQWYVPIFTPPAILLPPPSFFAHRLWRRKFSGYYSRVFKALTHSSEVSNGNKLLVSSVVSSQFLGRLAAY